MKLAQAGRVLSGSNLAESQLIDFGPLFPVLAQKPTEYFRGLFEQVFF